MAEKTNNNKKGLEQTMKELYNILGQRAVVVSLLLNQNGIDILRVEKFVDFDEDEDSPTHTIRELVENTSLKNSVVNLSFKNRDNYIG